MFWAIILYMDVRKEAALSSMIEGTQSSLSDLLMFEFEHQPGVPLNDIQEVSNYVAALYYGLQRLNEDFPLILRSAVLPEVKIEKLLDTPFHAHPTARYR